MSFRFWGSYGRRDGRGGWRKGLLLACSAVVNIHSCTRRRSADLFALAKFHILKFHSATPVGALRSREGLLRRPPWENISSYLITTRPCCVLRTGCLNHEGRKHKLILGALKQIPFVFYSLRFLLLCRFLLSAWNKKDNTKPIVLVELKIEKKANSRGYT